MNEGSYVLNHAFSLLPRQIFQRLVKKYDGDSKKTNYASIKDFIDTLHSLGCNMAQLNAINVKGFLSEENIMISEHIKNDFEMESLIWEIQDKKYILDGEDVGGDTIIEYIKEIQKQEKITTDDINRALRIMISGYDALFPDNSKNNSEILLKRLLLFYKDIDGHTFWKQTDPQYDRNYETSSWKRIIRSGAFIEFYKSITSNFKDLFKEHDLIVLLEDMQKEFFSEDRNRCFCSTQWSDRRLAILIDTITGGNLWSINKYPDLGFTDRTGSMKNAFIGSTQVGNRICRRKFQWQMIELPEKWEWHLQNMYRFYSFNFE